MRTGTENEMPERKDQRKPAKASPTASSQRYVTPELRVLGDFATLTQSGSVITRNDNAMPAGTR